MRIKEVKEKFEEIYNYIEEYKQVRPIMEATIEQLKGDVEALKLQVANLESAISDLQGGS